MQELFNMCRKFLESRSQQLDHLDNRILLYWAIASHYSELKDIALSLAPKVVNFKFDDIEKVFKYTDPNVIIATQSLMIRKYLAGSNSCFAKHIFERKIRATNENTMYNHKCDLCKDCLCIGSNPYYQCTQCQGRFKICVQCYGTIESSNPEGLYSRMYSCLGASGTNVQRNCEFCGNSSRICFCGAVCVTDTFKRLTLK